MAHEAPRRVGWPVEDARAGPFSRRALLRRALLAGGGLPAAAAALFAPGCRGPAPATPGPTPEAPVASAAPATTPGGTPGPAGAPGGATPAAPAPPATGAAAPAAPPPAVAPPAVRAIYLNPGSLSDDAAFGGLLALADRTELNAMVLDVKDETGWLYHDSAVALAREIGAVRPRYDLRRRLATLKAHGVHAIARVVCMQDPTLARARPALAVRHRGTGGVWANDNGAAWVNALRPEVWRYNSDVAIEAAQLGFDEVQYDYVRFPSDGDMAAIDLGAPSTAATRAAAVARGLQEARAALAPLGVPLAADIFGIVLVLPDDNNIGQQLEALAPAVDVLCPMLYPSHFPPGGLGWRVPNDHPYEVILESLQLGGARIDAAARKFRPWLQDFSHGHGIDYGPAEVRAQIQATHDFGATGWMLWNADNTYTEGALLPAGR